MFSPHLFPAHTQPQLLNAQLKNQTKMSGMEGIDKERYEELKKKRQFKKFTYRGIETDDLLKRSNEELAQLVCARARRRFQRGLKRKPMALIKKLRKAKKDVPIGEKPPVCHAVK